MATVSITDWDEKNTASIGNLSDSTSFTGLQKVQPIKITEGTGSGTGDAQFSSSTWNNIDSQDNIVVTKSDEATTRAYEIAELDTNNNVAWIWVYGSWNSDDSDQIVIGAGAGDGTDYSSPDNATGAAGGGDNPWGKTGIDPIGVWLFTDDGNGNLDAADSSGNDRDGTVNDATLAADGQFGDAGDFDGSNDDVSVGSFSMSDPYSFAIWLKPSVDTLGGGNEAFRWKDGGANNWKLDGSWTVDPEGSSGTSFTTNGFSSGDWLFVHCDYDNSNSLFEVFENASKLGSEGGKGSLSGSSELKIGNDFGSSYWPGVMDSVRLYNGTKGSEWSQAEYDASPTGGQVFFSWSGPESTGTGQTKTASLSEILAVSETRNEKLELFRSYDGSISLNDVDTKKFLKVLETETLSTSGTISKKFLKTLSENLVFSEQVSTNFGVLTGTVTLSGSPVQDAYVYVFEKTTEEFAGFDKTDSNGDYTVRNLKDNNTYLVAVDYDDSGTFYGDEKSIQLNDTEN